MQCDRNSPNTHSQSIACPSCQFWQNMFSNSLRKALLIWQNRCLNQILLNLWLTDWEWGSHGPSGWGAGSVKIIYFICWCSFNNDLWRKAFPFAASNQNIIHIIIMRGKVYLKIIHNLRFIFRLHSSEYHYIELVLFIYWQSREQILWIIRCPRVQYLHKWFSLFQSENKQQQPFEGRKNVESLINIEFFVCVGKWTISQQTLVYSIDVPLSPKINSFEMADKLQMI